jgi:MoxR-like ATPase
VQQARPAVARVRVEPDLLRYVRDLVAATRRTGEISLGAGPRAAVHLLLVSKALAALRGRDFVIPDDVKALAEPALAHRLIIKTSSSIHDVQAGQVVRELLETTPVDGIRPTRDDGPRDVHAQAGRAGA